jgi:TQXA domain-containing protein
MTRHLRHSAPAALAAAALTLTWASAGHAQQTEAAPVTGEAVIEEGLKLNGTIIVATDDGPEEEDFPVWANVLGLVPTGSDPEDALLVYCIDIRTDLDDESPYVEGDWEESEVPNLDLVRWVLFNGYPNVSADALFQRVGVDAPESWNAQHRRLLAYVATQAAVWHFTDDFRLDADKPLVHGNAAEDKAVAAVYKHLTAEAGRLPDPSEYYIDLEGVDDASYADGAFGPYTIRSTAGPVTLTSEGGSLVDASGKPVASLDDGGEFSIVLDEGSTEIRIVGTAAYDLPVGRVFLATTNEALGEAATSAVRMHQSQKLILAEPREAEIPAEWGFILEVPPGEQPPAPPAETPKPKLPATGASLAIAFGGGLALLIGGMSVLAFANRRRAAEH